MSIGLLAHDLASIRELVRQCTESNAAPEASGDVLCAPTLAAFEERRQALRSGRAPKGASLLVSRGRRFVVEQRYDEPSGQHVRTYSTFFGETLLEVGMVLSSAQGAQHADALLSRLSFREGVCHRR